MPNKLMKDIAKMKILAAGDFHGDLNIVYKLVDKSVKYNVDLVILNGDISRPGEDTENVIGPFVKKGKRVLLIPGNHETLATADFLAEVYGIKNIHGKGVKYENVGIFGCGSANTGIFQLGEEELFDTILKAHDDIKETSKKIMVTHIHPSGTLMENFSSIVRGSSAVRKAAELLKPDLLICGHVHEAEGIEEMIGSTKVLNVGKTGKIFEI